MRALMLSAGVGERMRPLTDHLPKPLLPIANRPVAAYVLEHLARHGFTEVVANLHYRADAIEEALGDGSEFGVSLHYSREEDLLGSAGGTKRCAEFLKDDTFLVIGSDDLTDMDLSELLRRHRQAGAVASIGLVEVEETSQFGIVVTAEDGRIQKFVEKPKGPSPSNTANTQIYLFEPEILDLIPPEGFYDYGFNLFPRLVESGAPFYGFSLPGYWRDIGKVCDYLAAQKEMLEGKVQARLPGEEVKPGVRVEAGAEVDPGAELTAPVIIGARSRVRAGARVGEGSAVGAEVEIPAGASLSGCVVWDGAPLPEGADLSRCVVLPDGTVAPAGG